MCIAVPAEVVSIDGTTATVDVYGDRLTVSLIMLTEQVQPGDFVTLRAQRYAVARMEREDAEAARRLFEGLFPELAARARRCVRREILFR